MKIKDIHVKDRPREKLIEYGAERLQDEELLAILLRTGIKGISAIELAKLILTKVTSVGLDKLSITDLKEIKGLGNAKAAEIIASFELGKRFLKDKKSTIFYTPENVWNALTDIRSAKKEHFVVLFLDARNQEIVREVISIGNLTASLVHPREVFEPAIKSNCAGIILAHNHPSGNLEPSVADIDITNKLVAAGKILSIAVLDHVIVTQTSWRSMKENADLKF